MENKNYSFTFETAKAPEKILDTLLDVKAWWSGLYGEQITGNSRKVNDEFIFRAGEGAHYSKQRLTELVPGKRVEWQVTDSDLTFLKKTDEWTGTKISFDIAANGKKNMVTFTHSGLVPRIECYNGCAGAWTKYLQHLAVKLA